MQGHRTTFASLSDHFNLEHGSPSNNTATDWSNLSDNRHPENLLPRSNSIGFMDDHFFDDRRFDLTSNNMVSVGQSSRSRSSPMNLDISSDFLSHGSEDYALVECPDSFKPSVSNNQRFQSSSRFEPESFAGPSRNEVNPEEENEGGLHGSIEGRHVPCKRKSFEGHVSQPLIARNSSHDQDAQNSPCPGASLGYNTAISGSLVISEQTEPRPQLGTRGASLQSSERLPRNFRLRLNASGQHPSDPMVGSELLRSDLQLLLGQDSSSTDMNAQVQPPELQDHAFLLGGPHRFSATGSGSSREAASGSLRNTLENHQMFILTGDSRALGQSSSLGGESIHIPRNLTPPQTGTSSTIQPPAPHRPMHYPRRLSENVRRTLSAVDSEPGGGRSSHSPMASGPSGSSENTVFSSRHGSTSNHSRRSLPLRSSRWLERQGDEGLLGLPYSLRTFATAGEGRRRLASEIRSVLDMMRRGQGLRFEDFTILDQSALSGIADGHDWHRDMRLDVDNMSYEELLALEERIGNVSTGLSEETILVQLKQRKCIITIEAPSEAEPCCICQEEYSDGEDLGTLECGHDFHRHCIKQWLMHKNLCPICKTTGLST